MTTENPLQPTLTSQKKEALKKEIFRQINLREKEGTYDFFRLISYIRKLSSTVHMENIYLKERLLATIENTQQKTFFWGNFFAFSKKMVSGFAVILIVFGFLSFLNVPNPVVYADTITKLDYVEGEVSVERGGQQVAVTLGMEIFENDQIQTGENSLAVIKYFDDSVSRLSAGSSLFVNSLKKNEKSPSETYVEVSLLRGSVWARVLNLVSDQSEFVVEAKDVYAKAKRAAFNVDIDQQDVQVQVFSRQVDVQKNQEINSIQSGRKVVVSGDQVAIRFMSDFEKNVAWVQSNLESDQSYLVEVEERLLAAKMESLGVKPDGEVSFENSLRENAALFLTFDDVDKKKKELDLAENKFIAAEIKLRDQFLTKGEQVEIETAVKEFNSKVKDFYDVIGTVETNDPEYAAELRGYLSGKIALHQKEMALVSPSSPVYELKKAVDGLSLVGLNGEGEASKERIEQILDELAEMEELSLSGETLSEDLAASYSKELDEAEKLLAGVIGEAEWKEEIRGKLNRYRNLIAQLTGRFADTATVVPTVSQEEPKKEDVVEVKEGEFGVKIEGDKVLPPGL